MSEIITSYKFYLNGNIINGMVDKQVGPNRNALFPILLFSITIWSHEGILIIDDFSLFI